MFDYKAILKKYWGYDSFRPLQSEIIESVCRGVDTLALMPTGGGKSLTYQIPALAMDGVCVVITPLIALMKDQNDSLRRKGILSVAIHSGMTPRQVDITLDNCVYGDYKFLFISPERIDSEVFRARFSKMKVSLIAVDEAHCISQWGFDFRPSYLNIARLRPLAPDAPVLALTASATGEVVNDIFSFLQFDGKTLFKASFARDNLSYIVRNTENKPENILRIINNVSGSGIIYVRTRAGAEKMALFLADNGISADFYHAGLGYVSRAAKQDDWLRGYVRVMVATNAFGMGIDKPDVRFVIHHEMCDSPESYYQEAGRAGRDGKPAYAVLLVSGEDKHNFRKRFEMEFPPPEQIKGIYEALYNYYQIETGGGKGQAVEFNRFDFCSRSRMFGPVVLNAIKILQLNGYMILTDEADHPPRVMFTVSRDDLYRIRVEKEELDHFIKVLLRSYTGLFSDFVPVNISELSHLSGYSAGKVNEYFKRLWQMRIIKFIPGNRSSLLVFTEERLSPDNVRISPESYAMRKRVALDRLASVVEYAEGNRCRSLMLQEYFGDMSGTPCGKCDICRGGAKKPAAGIAVGEAVVSLLVSERRIELHTLVARIGGDVNVVLEEIKRLSEEGTIIFDSRYISIKD